MPTVTIYALKDPRDGQIRYVGKTKQEPRKRFQGHLNEKRTTRKCRWFAALKAALLEPIILVLEEVPENEWEASERFWIEYCKLSGFNLTNHTDGGDGCHNLDAEVRGKLSASMKIRFTVPRSRDYMRDPARCAKISAALMGKPKSLEHVAKLPQNRPGRKLTVERRAAISKGLIGNKFRLGKPHDTATKRKISVALTGRPGISRPLTNEDKAKISAATKGKPKTVECKEKMRQSKLIYWSQFNREERRELLGKGCNAKKNAAEQTDSRQGTGDDPQ